MKWASSLSEKPAPAAALAECADDVLAQLGPDAEADLVVVFASPGYDQQSEPLGLLVRERFPSAAIVGCMGAGVIGGGREVEHSPALSVTAAHLPGVRVNGFHIGSDDLPSPDAAPDAWHRLVGVTPDLDPHFILLADPFSVRGEDLLEGLDFAFPAAAKIGGLASGGQQPQSHVLYCNGDAFRDGVVGVSLAGNITVDTVVAQGCRPVGEPMHVTEAEHNLVISVDGTPTMERLQAMFERMSPSEQQLVQHNLFVGLAMDPLQDRVEAGEFLIRNIVGVDPRRGAVAVGAEVHEGQIIQFHVRDAGTSAEDLRATLGAYLRSAGDRRGAAALMFQCTGRGEYLYGASGHDSALFAEMVGSVPLAGFFCNGEIGRVSGSTYVHSYTSSLAIFREHTGAG